MMALDEKVEGNYFLAKGDEEIPGQPQVGGPVFDRKEKLLASHCPRVG